MISTKNSVINNILMDCMKDFSQEHCKIIQENLIKNLYNYDIIEIEDKKQLPLDMIDNNYDVLQRFLTDKYISGRSQNTIKMYKNCIIKFIDYVDKPIRDITSDDVKYYFLEKKVKSQVSDTYIDNLRMYLSSFFGWCHNEEITSKNPMVKVDTIKRDTIKEKPFTNIELEKLRMNCKTLRERALIEFLLSTGCRMFEAVSVNRNQIDPISKQLQIIGKGNKVRTVYLSDIALVHITNYLNSRTDNNEALFVNTRRKEEHIHRMCKTSIGQVLYNIGNRANVEGVHPHRFRRTLCCTLLNKGVPIQTVKEIMGHSSIDTTMIYYNANEVNTIIEFNKVM